MKKYGGCAGLEGCSIEMVNTLTEDGDDVSPVEPLGLLDPAVREALLALEEEEAEQNQK